MLLEHVPICCTLFFIIIVADFQVDLSNSPDMPNIIITPSDSLTSPDPKALYVHRLRMQIEAVKLVRPGPPLQAFLIPASAELFPVPSSAELANWQCPKEYSIFVADLAPETSNSDLVAVFRNPVLGLRNDREPKFIRPFLSCTSAKVVLDPVTGVSRGYGFVRSDFFPLFSSPHTYKTISFTDEADQQRASIEMHGLYCLSRPSMSS